MEHTFMFRAMDKERDFTTVTPRTFIPFRMQQMSNGDEYYQ